MDIRVQKEIIGLQNNFDVDLFCSSSSSYYESNIKIYRKGPSTKKISKGLREIAISLFAFDPVMYFKLKKLLQKEAYDFIHVHDLPQFNTVYHITRNIKSLLILDMHENYPEAVKTWFSWRKSSLIRLKNHFLFNYKRWQKLEKKAVHRAYHIIAVVQEMKMKLIQEHGIPEDKITVISNYESKSFLKTISSIETNFKNNKFNVLYMGGLGPHRGLDDAISAIALLKFQLVELHIYGSGHKDNIDYLKKLVMDKDLQQQVFFHKPINFSQVPSLMSAADLNIIPHKKNGHCDNTIPHKLFQAMLVNKPLLVSNSTPLERTIEYGRLGYVFEANNPKSFALQLEEIYSDYSTAKIKAYHAFEKVTLGKMNWENESVRLNTLYSSLN